MVVLQSKGVTYVCTNDHAEVQRVFDEFYQQITGVGGTRDVLRYPVGRYGTLPMLRAVWWGLRAYATGGLLRI